VIADDIIRQARRMLADIDDKAFRWSKEDMFDYIKMACTEASKHRPDFLFKDNTVPTTSVIFDIKDKTQTLQLNDHAYEAIVSYTVYKALCRDSEEGQETKAMVFYQKYQAEIS